MYGKLNAYQEVANQSALYADPHRLIQMLMEGFLARVGAGRHALAERDFDRKGRELGRAVSILNGLRDTLDHDQGGDIAGNLDQLYSYMQEQVLSASASGDLSVLDHVSTLMRELKTGWDGVRDTAVTSTTGGKAKQAGVQVHG